MGRIDGVTNEHAGVVSSIERKDVYQNFIILNDDNDKKCLGWCHVQNGDANQRLKVGPVEAK